MLLGDGRKEASSGPEASEAKPRQNPTATARNQDVENREPACPGEERAQQNEYKAHPDALLVLLKHP